MENVITVVIFTRSSSGGPHSPLTRYLDQGFRVSAVSSFMPAPADHRMMRYVLEKKVA